MRAESLKTILTRAAIILIALLGAVYAGDYAILRYRIWRNRDPYGQVTVHYYDAVPLKNGKTEILPLAPEDETCVHSLLPHVGYNPCWYVSRHTEERIDL